MTANETVETRPLFPQIADLVPPKARAWGFAILAPLNVVISPVLIAIEGSRIYLGIFIGIVNTSGFGYALSSVQVQK